MGNYGRLRRLVPYTEDRKISRWEKVMWGISTVLRKEAGRTREREVGHSLRGS